MFYLFWKIRKLILQHLLIYTLFIYYINTSIPHPLSARILEYFHVCFISTVVTFFMKIFPCRRLRAAYVSRRLHLHPGLVEMQRVPVSKPLKQNDVYHHFSFNSTKISVFLSNAQFVSNRNDNCSSMNYFQNQKPINIKDLPLER